MENVGLFYGYLHILWPFGIFCCHLVNITVIWYALRTFGMYIISRFGKLYRQKSGNPVSAHA
jgi:hypothetical protein